MQRLSSCYFCGTALDASIDEYPVVPDRLRPASGDGADKTVVLCDTCVRKVDALLQPVVEAAEERSREPTETGSSGRTGDDTTDEPAGGGSDAADIESTLGDDEELFEPLGTDADGDDEELDPAAAAEASGMRFGDDRDADGDEDGDAGGEDDADDGPTYSDSRSAGFRREDGEAPRHSPLRSDDGGDSGGRDTARGTSGAGDSASGSNSVGESASGPNSAGDSTSETSPADGSDPGSTRGGRDDDGGSDDGETPDTPDVSMTRLENTKVMRLLENREFPVDKDDFVTVAASAYEISQRDCEKVLDLAIEHDLIHERDGQLYGGEL